MNWGFTDTPRSLGSQSRTVNFFSVDLTEIFGSGREPVPPAGERRELVWIELGQEALTHAIEVGRARRGEQLLALRGEHGEEAAGVGVAPVALEQALALEAIDQPGHAGAAEDHPVGE